MWRPQLVLFIASTIWATFAQRITETSVMERYPLSSGVCADGSPGFYYMAANASSDSFIFRLMGGGSCAYNGTRCEESIREISEPLFTSNGWPNATVGSGLLSEDPAENPLYSTFNRILVPYCTQDLFLLDTESSGGDLQFRGRPYLEEILTSVLQQSAESSKVVLLGSSAGGVGAFNVANWLLDSFAQVTELSLVLDSSFLFDVNGTLAVGLDYLRENPSAAYSSHCSEEFVGGPCCLQFGCMIHKGYYPTDDERLKGTMVLAPVQDALPLFLETGESSAATAVAQDEDEDVTFSSLWKVATYAGEARSLLHTIASIYPAAISVFAPSCTDHVLVVATTAELWMCWPGFEKPIAPEYYDDYVCTLEQERGNPVAATWVRTLGGIGLRVSTTIATDAWNDLQIDGTSLRTAIEQWWGGRGDASKQVFLFDSCDDFNCNPTCQGELLPGTRDESDDLLVWVMVLATFVVAVLILAAGIFTVVWGLQRGRRTALLVASALDKQEQEDGGISGFFSSLRDIRLQTSMETGEKKDGDGDCGSGVTPVLEWRNLSYWVPSTRGQISRLPLPHREGSTTSTASPREKQLLHSAHGTVPEGALCALMGPSGSGKSTLLDLLTGRKEIGRCDGEILFRGSSIAKQSEAYISQSGYMRQVNTGYLEDLTVLENLVYAAMLRLPGTVEHQSRRVQTVIEQTLLEKSAHTVARGLSGGQKRRLKIALELLVDRQILFLDEPSSGLDASASLELVALLKRLSRKVTLVVAIHQPRPEVWELFSHAILLSVGRTVYCGPTDGALAGIASYLMHTAPSRPGDANLAPVAISGDSESLHSSSWPLAAPVKAFGVSVLGMTRVGFVSNASKSVGPVRRTLATTPPKGSPEAAGCHVERVNTVMRTQRWHSDVDCDDNLDFRGALFEGQKNSTPLAPASASMSRRNGTYADPTRTNRSIPDKILDRLMMMETEFAGCFVAPPSLLSPKAKEPNEAAQNYANGHGRRTGSVSSTVSTELRPGSLAASDSTVSAASHSYNLSCAEKCKIPVWKIAAVLIARSCKNNYAKELVSSSLVLVLSLTFIVISLRVASDGSRMLHLVLSVLSVSMLPALLVYAPVMLIGMHDGWSLTKLEIADGFYSPRSAAVRYVIEHFAPAVLLSFVAVGITHAAFWGHFISALPASAIGVDLQLVTAMTLTSWVMVSFFDALVISGLSLNQATGISNSFNTIWAVFSGTILLVTSIPAVLRAVTYSSPHYWATFFGLRVLLDGLDLTASCDHGSKIYCPTSYGDLVAHALDLHIHTTSLSSTCLVAMASAGVAGFVTMVHLKGRHVRIIAGLRKPKD
eukprot:g11565.t1